MRVCGVWCKKCQQTTHKQTQAPDREKPQSHGGWWEFFYQNACSRASSCVSFAPSVSLENAPRPRAPPPCASQRVARSVLKVPASLALPSLPRSAVYQMVLPTASCCLGTKVPASFSTTQNLRVARGRCYLSATRYSSWTFWSSGCESQQRIVR